MFVMSGRQWTMDKIPDEIIESVLEGEVCGYGELHNTHIPLHQRMSSQQPLVGLIMTVVKPSGLISSQD